ncbi:hypothetical protein TNCV_96631 [Trichonephila clavipes]|nr:hypothetical protein TNCV_96631 [Trichonephila clavipes]
MARPGHQHSLVDAVAFPAYPRDSGLERDLVIWLTKGMFDKLGPTVKRNDTQNRLSWLRVCVECNRETRIGGDWESPETSSMIVRTQLEVEFTAEHYTSSVSLIPT